MKKYIDLIEKSIKACELGVHNLNEKALQINGMSSVKCRNLLNRLVALKDSRYLEIGVWKGSTFYSALLNNNYQFAFAIDNWSEYSGRENGTMKEFYENLEGIRCDVLDCDSFGVKPFLRFKEDEVFFNVYFYDGDHSIECQSKALTDYKEFLDNTFIYICDDWNMEGVEEGTRQGIKNAKLNVVKEWILPARYNGDLEQWWNGLYVAVLKKK